MTPNPVHQPLADSQFVSRGLQSGDSRCRLRPGLRSHEVLRRGNTTLVNQVCEKFVDVTAEGIYGTANGKERVNLVGAVGAPVQVPSVTGDGEVARDRDCLAVVVILVRYRPRVEVSEPDHDLVQVGTASGAGGEQIVGNISHDLPGDTLRPLPGRLHGGNRTELLVEPSVELNIGEALDASFICPSPLC